MWRFVPNRSTGNTETARNEANRYVAFSPRLEQHKQAEHCRRNRAGSQTQSPRVPRRFEVREYQACREGNHHPQTHLNLEQADHSTTERNRSEFRKVERTTYRKSPNGHSTQEPHSQEDR